MSYLNNKSEVREFTLPLQIALAVAGAAFLAFTIRLWYLQLFKGDEYRNLAVNVASMKLPIPADRGIIFDDTGKRLADNRASFDLRLTVKEMQLAGLDEATLFDRLATLLKVPVDQLKAGWEKATHRPDYSSYQPMPIMTDLSFPQIAAIDMNKADLPGIAISKGIKRTYLYGDLFANQIGYIGEITETELDQLKGKYANDPDYGPDFYEPGQDKGRNGIEDKYELELKGRDGKQVVLHDRLGRELSTDDAGKLLEDFKSLALAGKEEIPGDNLRLSIDLGLQQHIAAAFGEKSGAVVVMDVHTGAIRALFENPSFDPEIFARGISQSEWNTLQNDPDHPLEDKALRGMYPPGSTFKLFVAAAGLGEGAIDAKTTFHCTGVMSFGNRQYRCWNPHGHGTVDLHKAISQSCDIFFYNVGLKVGVDTIAKYARSFGLGERTGIGINSEKSGLIPTSEWKRIAKREEWQDGETLSTAIGQGFDLVTPLQLADAYAALANGGDVMEPHLVEEVETPDGQVVETVKPKVRMHADISPENLKLLQDGLFSVVNDAGGTAYWGARLDELHISGKTGSAQVIAQKDRNESLKMADINMHDHAWFAAFAPSENPQIAMAILVEHGDHGATAAAPIAKAIAEYWFREEIASKRAEKTSRVASAKTPVPTATATPDDAAGAAATATPAPTPDASGDQWNGANGGGDH